MKQKLIVFFIIFAVGFTVYANILNAPFHFDDYELMLGNPLLKDIPRFIQEWRTVGRKSLAFFTFTLNYYLGVEDPFGYHLVNVFLHIAAAILFYKIIKLLFLTPVLEKTKLAKQKEIFSLSAALIFLCHPLQTQSVTYIWQRTEVLSGLFYFLAYFFYLKGRLEKKIWCYALCILLFFIGLFAKGTIITVPLIIALTEFAFFIPDKSKKVFLKIWPYALLFIATFIFCWEPFVVNMGSLLQKLGFPFLSLSRSSIEYPYIITQLKVMMRYIQLCFVPINQNFDHYFPLSESFFTLPVILSFCVFVVIIAFAVKMFEKHRLVSFSIFWFFIYLLPTFLIGLRDPIWEHRLYISIAGFAVFLTSLIFTVAEDKKKRNIAIVSIVTILSILTISRNSLWRSQTAILGDSIEKSPMNPRPHLMLGAVYYRQGNLKKALELFKRTIELYPEGAGPYNNIGSIYMKIGNNNMAEEYLKRAIKADKSFSLSYINLAYIESDKRNYSSAIEYLNESLKHKITDAAYTAFGNIYWDRKKADKAIFNYQKAIDINPDNQIACFNLANIYFNKRDYEKALSFYKKAISINPLLSDAYINMGVLYYMLGKIDKARVSLEKAKEIDSQDPKIYKNLANIYHDLGEHDKARDHFNQSRSLSSKKRKTTSFKVEPYITTSF